MAHQTSMRMAWTAWVDLISHFTNSSGHTVPFCVQMTFKTNNQNLQPWNWIICEMVKNNELIYSDKTYIVDNERPNKVDVDFFIAIKVVKHLYKKVSGKYPRCQFWRAQRIWLYLVLLLLCRMSIDSMKKIKDFKWPYSLWAMRFHKGRESKTEWHVKVAYNTEWIMSY